MIVDGPLKEGESFKINSMHVLESGEHCFLLADASIYYFYFRSLDFCEGKGYGTYKIDLLDILGGHQNVFMGRENSISQINVQIKNEEACAYDIIVGTQDGAILHGVFSIDSKK